MAEESSTESTNTWPLPRFHFEVRWDAAVMHFQEVSGLDMNTIKRVPVTITLLDEGGKATMVWTLSNAWPTKITGTDIKAQGNEVAVETIEIAHEGLTIANS